MQVRDPTETDRFSKPPQRLQANGWATFLRFVCKEGYIDKWTGDCADHPREKEPSMLKLNSMATYYRMNKGVWWDRRTFKGGSFDPADLTAETRRLFTAQEIWDSNKVKNGESKQD